MCSSLCFLSPGSIFGFSGEDADDVLYVNWLSMVRAGLVGLEYFTPESNKWRQAHMQARYVILRVLQEIEGFVEIKECLGEDGQPDLLISLDKSKIKTVGKQAIGQFLCKLQIYKSTANAEAAEELYTKYSSVSHQFLKIRDVVLARKVPRRIFVQAHTEETNGKVNLVHFEASASGVVKSFATRYPEYCQDLQKLWDADRPHW
jgi:dipeptidyl-peptidase-3